MYSLLQRFFQNIFHRGQPALNGAADAAPANALGCRDLGLAHAKKIPSVDKSTQVLKACFGTLLRSRRLYYIQ